MDALTFIGQCLVLIGLPLFVWLIPCIRRWVPLVPIQIASSFLVGPSILGKISPAVFDAIFPSGTVSVISKFAVFAVVTFGFMTGLHIDLSQISRQSDSGARGGMRGAGLFWTISFSSVLKPMLLGIGVAYVLMGCFDTILGENATPLAFASSFGLAVGIVALPVLSACLVETGEIHSQSGKFSLACAMVHDAFLWIFMTVLLLLLPESGHGHSPFVVFGLTVLYVAVMVVIVRPLLATLDSMESFYRLQPFAQVTVIAIPLLLSAGATEWIGIHYMLGAVMCGAMMPDGLKKRMIETMEPVLMALVLPFFLGSAGIRVQFEATDPTVWILFGAIVATTYVGQFIGTILPARFLFKQSWHDSLTLGAYMTSKGILEIVVATILLDAHVISNTTYAALLMGAVVLTGLTIPLTKLVRQFLPASQPTPAALAPAEPAGMQEALEVAIVS